MFVHAEQLTSDPQSTMDKVWQYLGEEPFTHDVTNVEQYTKEHELGWPYGDHSVRSEVKPLQSDWHDTLGRQISETLNKNSTGLLYYEIRNYWPPWSNLTSPRCTY
jgi:hypothetical protein